MHVTVFSVSFLEEPRGSCAKTSMGKSKKVRNGGGNGEERSLAAVVVDVSHTVETWSGKRCINNFPELLH